MIGAREYLIMAGNYIILQTLSLSIIEEQPGKKLMD
jgi:hypothetical protein